jgi:hypothetical protein
MRVLVSVDMEGAAGVVDREDVSPGEGAYEHNRALRGSAPRCWRGLRGAGEGSRCDGAPMTGGRGWRGRAGPAGA